MKADSETAIDISVSIVSYNTRDLLRECLLSLQERSNEAHLEIIVIDNGSHDGSAEMVEREFPAVILKRAGENLGYGIANNRALEGATGKYFWVLNSDTTIEPKAITTMLKAMRSRPQCGAIGARLILPDGSTQPSCAGDPSLWAIFCEQTYLYKLLPNHPLTGGYAMTDWSYDQPRNVAQVCGASLLVRREAWRQAGGFDAAFFMYFEDTDFCLRLRRAGWEIWFEPEARIRHHLGGSSARDWRTRARMIASYNWSRVFYFGRYKGRCGAQMVRALALMGAFLRALSWRLVAFHPARRQSAREQVKIFREVWRRTRAIGNEVK